MWKDGNYEALAVTQGDRNRQQKGKCHNCGKQVHWARKCQSPKKDQQPNNSQSQSSGQSSQRQNQPPPYQNANKAKNKPVGSANAVNDGPNGCWSAIFISNVLKSGAPVPTPLDSEEAGKSAAMSCGLAGTAIMHVMIGVRGCLDQLLTGYDHSTRVCCTLLVMDFWYQSVALSHV